MKEPTTPKPADTEPADATGLPSRWEQQIAALDSPPPGRSRARDPLSTGRIVEAALDYVARHGYSALTMRRVAAELRTGAATLYAHVQNKAELDDLLIGELTSRVVLPEPDPDRWHEQIVDVCRQVRDQFIRYRGIAQAALAAAPRSLDTFRINEGMLAILLAGGVKPQPAAWAIDAAYLYVCAYSLETSLRLPPGGKTGAGEQRDGGAPNREDDIARLRMLPATHFPTMAAHVHELTAGTEHERFEFTLDLLFRDLAE